MATLQSLHVGRYQPIAKGAGGLQGYHIHLWASDPQAARQLFSDCSMWYDGNPATPVIIPPRASAQITHQNWNEALHTFTYMMTWAEQFGRDVNQYKNFSEHDPLHELVHRATNARTGISNTKLYNLVRDMEHAPEFAGFTRINPYKEINVAV